MTRFYDIRKWCGFCGESRNTKARTCDVCGRILRTKRRYDKGELEVARI